MMVEIRPYTTSWYMIKEPNGDIIFERGSNRYVFDAYNYKSHCLRHPKIIHDKHLAEIEGALCDPDVTTQSRRKGRYISSERIYYKVQSYQNNRSGTFVRAWKIVVYLKQGGGTIATAYEVNALNSQLIHYLEKVLWRKPNSLI